MISSVGSSLAYDCCPTAKPAAGLDAQIARFKKELSDCVNCESAKTTKGKAKIQAISDKITALTAHAEKATEPKDTNQSAKLGVTLPINNHIRAGYQNDIELVADYDFVPVGNSVNAFA
jgi:hypothetical protein